MSNLTVSVLFVCLGNICRSPTAHAVFRRKVKEAGLQNQILVDSAGTGDWHIGDPPDARSAKVAESKGYDMCEIFARQICTEDFENFDYILVMDDKNYKNIQRLANGSKGYILDYFLSYSEVTDRVEVPDPYYGAQDGFDQVLELIGDAADGLLAHIRKQLERA